MSAAPGGQERIRVVEAVQRLVAEQRLSLDELRLRLTLEDLRLLRGKATPELEVPLATHQRLAHLLELVATRRVRLPAERDVAADEAPLVVGAHGAVPHEIASLRVLLVEFEAADAVQIWNWLQLAQDTHFEIERVERIEDAPARLDRGDVDAVLLDLTREQGRGVVTLARAEVAASHVPVIAVIARADEPQLLHLGSRDYLIKSQINSRLLVRTLRSAVEHHRLIEELRAARQREQYHATRDAMTGLPNRHCFVEQLEHAIALASRRGSQVAVCFLDLDRFKQINDTLGHDVGDALINTMADRLACVTRRSDLLARVGGDEFLMLLQGDELDRAAVVVAHKILAALARPFRVDGREYALSGSVGIALYPRDGEAAEELIRRADAAMYEAKGAGRSRYQLYNRALSAALQRKQSLEAQLREAVARRALAVHYQPRVDVVLGRVVGAEALARWEDPLLGTVSPQEFVPIAEETGLIGGIGEQVLEAACAAQRRWREAGHAGLVTSVNVSARQLFDESIRELFANALWRSGVEPTRLELEVTERALVQHADAAESVLRELAELGVGVLLDDFGSGLSSLSLLTRFPVRALKLDRSLVAALPGERRSAALAEAILALAEKLGLRVVAEGVETREQLEFLRHRGCREMQGFLWSPALAPDDFLVLLRHGLPVRT